MIGIILVRLTKPEVALQFLALWAISSVGALGVSPLAFS